jgi:hypothetical protein
MPYVERFCRSCDLGKVKDEEHLFLVCPNTQKVKERFCSALPFTHTSTLTGLMQTTNTIALAKFVACCQY